MKANEAPEKIYLQHVEDGRLWPAWFTIKILNDDIEYVHTDAFIEKAVKWINEYTSLSEKLVIENFRKYIEGE